MTSLKQILLCQRVSILIQLEVGWEDLFSKVNRCLVLGFNPYSVGSRLGSPSVYPLHQQTLKFQSLFSWKQVGKLKKKQSSMYQTNVSILIQLEVGWEERIAFATYTSIHSFNPYSVGSRLGSRLGRSFLCCFIVDEFPVSILIQLEVGWEAATPAPNEYTEIRFNPYSVGSRLGSRLKQLSGLTELLFQSLFSWKQVGKSISGFCPVV